jgi:hypothetical protein
MRQTGHFAGSGNLSKGDVHRLLMEHFEKLDYQQAKADIQPFITDPSVLELWSDDFFQQITRDKLKIETDQD